jgi:hypothetical protein
MGRFTIGERIALIRMSARTDRPLEAVCTGVVKSEAFVVEKIDHYQVEWDKQYADHFTLICDMPSLKYKYVRINN